MEIFPQLLHFRKRKSRNSLHIEESCGYGIFPLPQLNFFNHLFCKIKNVDSIPKYIGPKAYPFFLNN